MSALADDTARGDHPASAPRTLPWSWYADPEIAAREHAAIFRRAWQYAGRREELTAPGSFAAAHVAGLSVVLTRDRDDVLRAFANVCRHRGAIVASGTGERGTLQCPYHAWTYGLDGCLRAAPRSEPGFDTTGLGLAPMAVGTWGPFVFVNPDVDAEPLEQALGDLPAIVRERASTSMRCASTTVPSTRSARTGRSRSRTTSSATTAGSTTPGSCPSSTTAGW